MGYMKTAMVPASMTGLGVTYINTVAGLVLLGGIAVVGAFVAVRSRWVRAANDRALGIGQEA